MKVYIGKYPKDPSKERKINVRIDRWDTWSMDQTLAPIILPMLKQLKRTKHGSPCEMPAFAYESNQHPQICFDFYSDGDVLAWDNGHKQWEEVMDKMIWSFEQHQSDWEEQYHSGDRDLVMEDVPGTDLVEVKHGKNHTHKFDFDGYKKHLEKIREGFELFGKHYMSLWD